MDEGPHGQGHKGGGVGGAAINVELAAPGRQVGKGQGGGADDPAVKVVGEVLGGLEALAAAGGAAEVVRLGVGGAVKGLRDGFADDDARVHGAVGKVLDDVGVVEEGDARHSVVAVVGGDGGEALGDRVSQVAVLDAAADAAVARTQEAPRPRLGRRQPGLHGQVGPCRCGHEQRHAAHVDGHHLRRRAAASHHVGERQVGAGRHGRRREHRRVGVQGGHGGGEVGALRVEGSGAAAAAAVLRGRRGGEGRRAEGQGSGGWELHGGRAL